MVKLVTVGSKSTRYAFPALSLIAPVVKFTKSPDARKPLTLSISKAAMVTLRKFELDPVLTVSPVLFKVTNSVVILSLSWIVTLVPS